MRAALDTNILVYAEGVNSSAQKQAALKILGDLPRESTFIPVQALGELFHVLMRKAGRTPEHARNSILSWQDTFPSIETSSSVFASAVDLSLRHGFTIWDSIIISAAAAASCRILLSEDLQTGFTWGGVTVINPFLDPPHPLLEMLLNS